MDGLSNSDSGSSKSTSNNSTKSKMKPLNFFCICGYGDGEMIGCEGEKCEGSNWYHLECIGLRTEPRGPWLCQTCTERKAIETNRIKTSSPYSKRHRHEIFLDESKYVVSKADIIKKSISTIPLKVEAAENQSRQDMEKLSSKSKLIEFSLEGKAIDKDKIINKASTNKIVDDFPQGLCKFKLSTKDFESLQSLHRLIVRSLNSEERLTSWAGIGESDKRKRGYAFLPHTYGKFGKTSLTSAGIHFHAAEKKGITAQKDENANWKSCIRLKDCDMVPEYINALKSLIDTVKDLVEDKYKHVIDIQNLQALQPNLHNGLDHLPAHIDSPLNDGFGVVIVTIAVHQNADIIMLSNKSTKSWIFPMSEGEVYVLSGDARNLFDHGVICPLEKRQRRYNSILFNDTDQQEISSNKRKRKNNNFQLQNIGRESLNLRFGIHSNKLGNPLYVYDEMPLEIFTEAFSS